MPASRNIGNEVIQHAMMMMMMMLMEQQIVAA